MARQLRSPPVRRSGRRLLYGVRTGRDAGIGTLEGVGGGEFQCHLYVVHVCLVVARGETHVRRFSHQLSIGATNWSELRSCLHAQPISLSRHIDCTQPNCLDALLDVVLGISGLVGGTGKGLVRALLGRGGGLSGLVADLGGGGRAAVCTRSTGPPVHLKSGPDALSLSLAETVALCADSSPEARVSPTFLFTYGHERRSRNRERKKKRRPTFSAVSLTVSVTLLFLSADVERAR